MDSKTDSDLLSMIIDDDLTLSYAGVFTDSMTDMIIELSEAYLESHEQMSKLKRKTSFLVAECFQNVVRHGANEEEIMNLSQSNDSFLIRFKNNACFIASENSLPNSQIEALKRKLEEVNKHEKEELKALYRQILEEGELSDKGGAGLGLIEMARKTGNKLTFSFKPIEDNKSVYSLMLVLQSSSEEDIKPEYDNELSQIVRFTKMLRDNNQFLFYKGGFEQDIILPMVQMIEQNMDSQVKQPSSKMKLYHAAVELMQNISHHGALKNGKHTGNISIGRQEENFTIQAANPIEKEAKTVFDGMLNELKGLSKEELNQKYREKLRSKMESSAQTGGLGLIDLARISKTWNYEFSDLGTNSYQYIYNIQL